MQLKHKEFKRSQQFSHYNIISNNCINVHINFALSLLKFYFCQIKLHKSIIYNAWCKQMLILTGLHLGFHLTFCIEMWYNNIVLCGILALHILHFAVCVRVIPSLLHASQPILSYFVLRSSLASVAYNVRVWFIK